VPDRKLQFFIPQSLPDFHLNKATDSLEIDKKVPDCPKTKKKKSGNPEIQ